MDVQWWVNNGVSVAMLTAIAVGCFYSAKWIGQHFLLPIRDRILKFFDTLEAALNTMAEHDTSAATVMGRVKELADSIRDELRVVSESCLRTEEHMETLGLRRSRRRRGPRPPSDPPHPRPAT